MPTIQKRNFFSETVSHPSGAVTLAALMRLGGWGTDSSGNKSADSFTGDNAMFIPTTDMFVGWDENVADAADVGPPVLYKGVLAVGGDAFNVTAWCRGVAAADDVWIFSAGVQDMQIVFQSV